MHGPGELLGQRFVDEPLAGDAGQALERFGNDLDVKMALAAPAATRTRAGMAGMAVGVVAKGKR